MHYNSGGSNLELVYAASVLKALGHSINVLNESTQTRIEVIINIAHTD